MREKGFVNLLFSQMLSSLPPQPHVLIMLEAAINIDR